MPSYLNLSTAKDWLSLTGSTYDARLTLVLNGVEQSIETWCGRPMARTATVEFYSTDGSPELWLDRWPIAITDDIASVHVDYAGYWGQGEDAFASETELTAGTEYAVRLEGVSKRAVLYRIGDVWPYAARSPIGYLSSLRDASPGSVRVAYTAGFSQAAPADVISAAYDEVSAIWFGRTGGRGYGWPTSESVAGASASITPFGSASEGLAASPFRSEGLFKALRPYRKIPLGR